MQSHANPPSLIPGLKHDRRRESVLPRETASAAVYFLCKCGVYIFDRSLSVAGANCGHCVCWGEHALDPDRGSEAHVGSRRRKHALDGSGSAALDGSASSDSGLAAARLRRRLAAAGDAHPDPPPPGRPAGAPRGVAARPGSRRARRRPERPGGLSSGLPAASARARLASSTALPVGRPPRPGYGFVWRGPPHARGRRAGRLRRPPGRAWGEIEICWTEEGRRCFARPRGLGVLACTRMRAINTEMSESDLVPTCRHRRSEVRASAPWDGRRNPTKVARSVQPWTRPRRAGDFGRRSDGTRVRRVMCFVVMCVVHVYCCLLLCV